jgi:hypothetical protein
VDSLTGGHEQRGKAVALGVGALSLFLGAGAVFLLPFIFPTPPPIVGPFKSPPPFSPNGDRFRDVAVLRIRMNQRATVNLDIRECTKGGRVLRHLLTDTPRPRGRFATNWNGLDDAGTPLADGSYCLSVRAKAGEKSFNNTWRVRVDKTPPRISQLSIGSAALLGRGVGECRIRVGLADPAKVTIQAAEPRGRTLYRIGPRPIAAGKAIRWAWRGNVRGQGRIAPGPYRITVAVSDLVGNRQTVSRSCWAGFMIGRTVPRVARRGQIVRVRLTTTDGRGLAPATPITLALYRKVADPGASLVSPLGSRVARIVRGPLGSVSIRLPDAIGPASLWLVARTPKGRALIPLGRR